MPPKLPAGPYRTFTTAEGRDFPYYVIPFDKDGNCEGPHTRDHLLNHAGEFTDIFVFSHGWNNDWTAATSRYEHFINGLIALRKAHGLAVPVDYRPMLVGIFWPSQALEWFDSETGPDIAAADPAAQDAAAEAASFTLRDIASSLPADRRTRFYELAQLPALDDAQARELATMLASLTVADDEGVRDEKPSADDLLAAARAISDTVPDLGVVGTVGGSAPGDDPQAAFGVGDLLRTLDPRNLIKPFTVWTMKDRAGVVGARGVSPLLAGLLQRSLAARIHLLGHSFGCKVVMTAVARLPAGLRRVESALLLQPAVSQYAFASRVPERGVPGGFVPALTRVRRPIVASFSDDDMALRRAFHLAVRRSDDVGELQAAAGSLYGALGGFGPLESNAAIVSLRDPVEAYDLQGTDRIIGVNGTGVITGHGEISNEATWWLAYSLATAHMRFGV